MSFRDNGRLSVGTATEILLPTVLPTGRLETGPLPTMSDDLTSEDQAQAGLLIRAQVGKLSLSFVEILEI